MSKEELRAGPWPGRANQVRALAGQGCQGWLNHAALAGQGCQVWLKCRALPGRFRAGPGVFVSEVLMLLM